MRARLTDRSGEGAVIRASGFAGKLNSRRDDTPFDSFLSLFPFSSLKVRSFYHNAKIFDLV